MRRVIRPTGRMVPVCLALLLVLAGVSFAQEFPTKQVNLLIANNPQGSVNGSARLLASEAEKLLKQPVVVNNNGAGAGSVAAGIVAKQPPDGYHIIAGGSTILVRIPQFRPVDYKFSDFMPVMSFGELQSGLYVRADSPWKTLKDFIDYAKKNPGKVTYTITGTGTPQHLCMEFIAKKEGIQWRAVPASGDNPTIALLGGHVTASSAGTAYVNQVRAGALRLLAVHSEKRLKAFPNVPTFRESGYDFVNDTLILIAAPKGTPAPIVKKLDEVFHRAMEKPEFVKYMESVENEVVYRNSDETAKYLLAAYTTLGKMIKDLNVPTEHK